jgi:hypothetical protein
MSLWSTEYGVQGRQHFIYFPLQCNQNLRCRQHRPPLQSHTWLPSAGLVHGDPTQCIPHGPKGVITVKDSLRNVMACAELILTEKGSLDTKAGSKHHVETS